MDTWRLPQFLEQLFNLIRCNLLPRNALGRYVQRYSRIFCPMKRLSENCAIFVVIAIALAQNMNFQIVET